MILWKEHCKLNCKLTKERKASGRNTRRKISTPKKQQLTLATIMETTKVFLLASTMAEWVILLSNGGEDLMLSVKKCNKLGHHVRICRSNFQQRNVDQVADQQEEEQLFVTTCFTSSSSSECWLVDSGCTNHMTHDQELFRELDR